MNEDQEAFNSSYVLASQVDIHHISMQILG